MKLDKPAKLFVHNKVAGNSFKIYTREFLELLSILDRSDGLTFQHVTDECPASMIIRVAIVRDILNTYESNNLVKVTLLNETASITLQEESPKEFMAGGRSIQTLLFESLPDLPRGECSKMFVSRIVTGQEAEESTNAQPADSWLAMAIGKNSPIPGIERLHGNMACDSYRIHYRRDISPSPRFYDDNLYKTGMEYILKCEAYPIAVNLDKKAGDILVKACKLAKKTHASHIVLSVNGKLDYTFTGQDSCSKDEVKNDGSIVAGYDHTGDDIRIAVNPIYLMQAIQGGKKSTLKFFDANSPMYYTDGENREAIIMAMRMDAA